MDLPEFSGESELPDIFASLHHQVNRCRQALERDPCDMNSRLDLAWFLFLQGVACSGQISSHGPNGDSAEFTLSTEGSKLGELPQIGAQELFRAALHETISVEHLGRDSHLQLEIERLHSLARLLGGSKLLDERAREAIQIQMRLFYDLSDSEENEGDEEEPMLE